MMFEIRPKVRNSSAANIANEYNEHIAGIDGKELRYHTVNKSDYKSIYQLIINNSENNLSLRL